MQHSLLNRISSGLHRKMSEAGVDAPSIPVIEYALNIIFNTASASGLALIAGLITGKFPETAIVIFTFAMIRYISGGYHLRSSISCALISAAVLSIIPHISLNVLTTYTLTGISMLVTFIVAPSNYDKYARIPKRFYPLLKVTATLLIACNFFIASDILAVTFIIQTGLLLIPTGGVEDEEARI